MLPATTVQRLAPLLENHGVELAYYLYPLPRGVLSAAQGGLAVRLSAPTPSQRYDTAQRLRFQLMMVMPPGQSEVLVLNDSRLDLALTTVGRGALVYARDAGEQARYEMLVLSQSLDLKEMLQRFFEQAPDPSGRSSV